MPATPIAASNRYVPQGVTHYNYLPACANISSPTRAEINAGTDLTPELAEAGDWAINSEAIDTPDYAAAFTPQIPGNVTVDGTTLNLYADIASADVRTLLPRNTTGFILKLPGGDVAGRKADVFPIKVGSQGKPNAIGTPSTINLIFYVTRAPAENVTIPA
jgi:hypothetical protein